MAQINIAGTIHNTEEIQGDALHSHVAVNANEVLDATQGKKQSDINAAIDGVVGNKAYAPADYSGLGRKYLPKNVKAMGGVTANYLEQSMLTESNTIYVIQYDFTVSPENDNTITVPAGCVLEFEGGSVSNGTLTGNNTQIAARSTSIFTGITIGGTWVVPEITSAWFGDAAQDNRLRQVFALQNANVQNTIIIEPGEYAVSVESDNGSALTCLSNLNLIINGNINLAANAFEHYYIVDCQAKHHITISGSGTIVGDKSTHTGETGEWGMGIRISGSSYITIKNFHINDCWGDCIYIGGNGASNIIIDNCDIDNGRRQGISITNGDNIVIQNCLIHNVGGTNPQAAIDIETNTNKHASNIFIVNNQVVDCLLGIVVYGRSSYTKANILIENNYIDCTWRAISANGVSTCITARNNELRTLYCTIEANTADGSKDNVILFENNMIYQTEIPTESPYNTSTRMCTVYAMKGDYMFKHNCFNTVMPVFRFASGHKYVEDNEITCPTLFALYSSNYVIVTGNKIVGNVTLPGNACRFESNNVTGYIRSTPENIGSNSCRIIGNTITHPVEGSEITANWESTLVDDQGQPIPVENYNKICELNGKNIIIENNSFVNVSIKLSYEGCRVVNNRFVYNSNFTMIGILLNLSSADFLYNTVDYQGSNENDSNIYMVRTSKSIVGNTMSSASRIKFVFYATSGCFISGNSITLPVGHDINCIIQSSQSLFVEPSYRNIGSADERPAFPQGDSYYMGCKYFDTTLQKTITWNGYMWMDNRNEPVDYKYKKVIDDYTIGKRYYTRYDVGTEISLNTSSHSQYDCKAIDVVEGQIAFVTGVGGYNGTTYAITDTNNILLKRSEAINHESVLPSRYPHTFIEPIAQDGKLIVNFSNETITIEKTGDPNYGEVVPYYNEMNIPYKVIIYSNTPFPGDALASDDV